tara:strand:+ start:453 stop:2279 length:1827 start_codon:yes stop_codon:yes gene_type:complete
MKRTRKTPSKLISTKDQTTDYAKNVTSGAIIAGPHVRNSCKRHLNDLKVGKKRGLIFDVAAAQRAIGFFRDVLTVEIEYEDEDGEVASRAIPFVLAPAQCFIIGSLYGWKNKLGYRRFRRAYVEQGKGNGKSPLAAGIGHLMLTADKKIRAEVYSAATDMDQAQILFRDAVAMRERSPALEKRLSPSGLNPVWQLTDLEKLSFFKPIASNKKGKSGIRPHCALIDEVHEHPDNSVIEMLRAGTKGNKQALIFEITNSGYDRDSVCWHEHEYSCKIAEGEIENDSWFSYVCALDEKDDPFKDESCWVKANPLIGISIQPEYIREQVEEAKGMPSKEAMVRRLHFCQWTDAESAWITRGVWEKIEEDVSIEDFSGQKCWAGLDLSYTTDLSALSVVFRKGDIFYLFVFFWKPKIGLADAEKRDGRPYALWAQQGFLFLTEGKVIKLGPIAQKMGWLQDNFDLEAVAYDAYRHKELAEDLSDLGFEIPMIEHPQGFRRVFKFEDENGNKVKDDNGNTLGNPLWMPDSVQAMETAIIEETLRTPPHPVLRSHVSAVVVRLDPAGTDNKILDKRKSIGRIDGAVSSAMAIGAAKMREIDTSGSIYNKRGLLVI